MKALFLIPARGGSKGLPGKNVKTLSGIPLINHSILFARQFTTDENICLSTDDPSIAKVAESIDLSVPFLRPKELSTDEAGSYEVMLHALDYFEQRDRSFDWLVFLQPTSPLRKKDDLEAMLSLCEEDMDAVISVTEETHGPNFGLYRDGGDGFLKSVEQDPSTRRQDAPVHYRFNGSIYLLRVSSLRKFNAIHAFPKIRKYVMDALFSIDIDTVLDFEFCQFLLDKKMVENK